MTPDLVRYQGYIRNLHQLGFIDSIESRMSDNRFVFLEIGAGYGCLPYQLLSRYKNKMTAVIIDLPIMLLFSGVYLLANIPNLNLFIYDPENPEKIPDPKDYDAVLLPNYRLDLMEKIKEIDLAFNSISFQEMSISQVRDYVSIIEDKLKGGFYYHGSMPVYSYDDEKNIDVENVVSIIGDRFNLVPSKGFYLSKTLEQVKSEKLSWPVTVNYQFLALPSNGNHSLPPNAKIRSNLPMQHQASIKITDSQGRIIEPEIETSIPIPQKSLNIFIKRFLKFLGLKFLFVR